MMKKMHLVLSLSFLCITNPVIAKSLIDYFMPIPIYDRLESTQGGSALWGAAGVIPREMHNGLEDTTNKICYWDGKIIRAKNGKYHMFGSRWPEKNGHGGWGGSVAIHAVSDKPTGPYIETEMPYTSQSGKGHNVTADILPDGRYVILVSETRPGDIFTSSSLDGPWTFEGSIKVEANGFTTSMTTSNLSMCVCPNGNILMVCRPGYIMLSTTGILGPYKVQTKQVYPKVPNMGYNSEDPCIWYSGGKYHITYNYWDKKKAYHITSLDGIHNWTLDGLAYDPTTDFIRYTDGTVNHWCKMERPGVLIEDGHVTHFTFAVLDVEKDQEKGNDNHGSKIIVVPFDGIAFDGGGSPTVFSGNPVGPAQDISLTIKYSGMVEKQTFSIPANIASTAAPIKLLLYDMRGRQVCSLYNGPANIHEINYNLDRRIVGAGAYVLTLRYGKWVVSKKQTIH